MLRRPGDRGRAARGHARASRRLETFRSIAADAEDLAGLAELVEEDTSLQDELGEQLDGLEERLAELEETA